MHRVPDYADRRLKAALDQYLENTSESFAFYTVTSRVNKESHTAWLVVVGEESWTVRDFADVVSTDGRVSKRKHHAERQDRFQEAAAVDRDGGDHVQRRHSIISLGVQIGGRVNADAAALSQR